MGFAETALGTERPQAIRTAVRFPHRQQYHPSPRDWRDEVLYFLLVDRFSDARENTRPLLDRSNLAGARPDLPDGSTWRWDRWAASGADRWQGGTLAGVQSKLDYLQHLGVTTLWLSPIFKQRGHLNTYHGYGIQDFLDVDPRFGDRHALVDLATAAHARGLRVILDVIFNHSGPNWIYPDNLEGGAFQPKYTSGRYPFGAWLDRRGDSTPAIAATDDGVWPRELQNHDRYTRAGSGDLGAGNLDDPFAEHKRTDFLTLRDFDLDAAGQLSDLISCYKYWIALTDCDGFRIDTLKHVSLEQARTFCGAIKEFAANIGKANFFLVGEIAGGDYGEDRYLDVLARNLNAALDIGELRLALNGVAKGLRPPRAFFDGFDPGNAVMGSHRNLGDHHVSILDDHDHVFGEKIRFSAEAARPHQVVAGAALQLLTLGIPCLYYGTEQALGGPEPAERPWLPEWKKSDRYLREAMFGPDHPRASGRPGLPSEGEARDPSLPGFGPFGTAGHHCFDEKSSIYRRIAALAKVRRDFPVLRLGRQYPRPVSFLDRPFDFHGPGEILAWSRLLDDEEALVVLNAHGDAHRGADIVVDAALNAAGSALTIVLNTAEVGAASAAGIPHPIGSQLSVQRASDGTAFVSVRDLPESDVLVAVNRPVPEEGGVS